MRLYSRHQVIGIVLVTAAVTVIGTFALHAFVSGALNKRGTAAASIQTEQTAGSAESSFKLETNIPQASLPVADKGEGYTQDETQNITVYQKANEAVVNITTEIVGINWFLEPVPQEGGSGSGSIIDTRGYVVTNSHVIADAVKISISLSDGSQYEGKVVGIDKENDIAVLKFDPPKNEPLTTIAFGESNGLKVGQKVLAIGNPFGLERTLTTGIVSALGRPIRTESNTIIKDMIQTDTAINPGNSGGPLLDTQGRMIGINTMIYSPSGGSVGIGFAIPVDTAIRIVPELIKEGKVRRGWIDIEAIQLFPALITYLKQSEQPSPVEQGLLVSAVRSGSSAEKAGLKGGATAVRYGTSTFKIGGDIITAVDGQAVGSIADLYTALEDNKPGEKVWVEYYRGKQKSRIQVTLSEQSQQQDQ